ESPPRRLLARAANDPEVIWCPPSLSGSKEPGRPYQQHQGGDKVERRELKFREELNPHGPDDADDDGSDERALEAAKSAYDHNTEDNDQRDTPHAKHCRLRWTHDGSAETGHKATDREGQHVNQPDVETQRRGHPPILRCRSQQDSELGVIDPRPKDHGRDG